MKKIPDKTILKATLIGVTMGCSLTAANAQSETAETTETPPGSEVVLETVVINAAGTSAAETGYVAPTSISRIESDPLDTAQTVTAVTAARIEDQNIRSDLDLLNSSPAVDATSNEGFVSIRGFGADRAIDGVTVGSFIGRTSADLSAFEQVEILKGPAAIFQGNGGFGGMINYSFKRPHDTEALHTKVGFGDPSTKQLMVDYNMQPMLDGRLRARFVGSFEDQHAYRYPEKYERASFFGVTEFDLTDQTTLRFSAWRQRSNEVRDFRQGVPTWNDGTLIDFPADTTATQDWALFRFRSLWLNAEIEHRFNDDWKLKLSYRNGDSHHPSIRSNVCYDAEGNFNYSTDGIDRDNPDGRSCHMLSYWNDWNQYEVFDATLNGEFDALGRPHEVMVGFTQQRSWFRRAFGVARDGAASDFVVDIFDPDHHVTDRPAWVIDSPWGAKGNAWNEYQLFGQVNFQATERLTLPIGGRLTWVRTDDGDWTAKREFTPSVAAVYKLNDNMTVYAQYARMFSANTWAYGWNSGWTDGIPQNPQDGNLLPNVTGTQKEIGIKANVLGGALATASVFELKEQNRARVDTNPDHPALGDDVFYVASGETRSRGLELSLNGEVRPGWEVGAGYAYIDAKYTKDDDLQGVRLGTSRHSGNIWTKYRFQSERLDGLTVGAGMRFKSPFLGYETDENDTNRVKAPGYAIVSAMVGYDFNQNLSAVLNVDNLFDKKHYDQVGERGGDNYMGDMRRVTFSLSSRF